MDEETRQTPEGDWKPVREGDWVEDISNTVAPSVGPHSTVTHHAHTEQKPPDVDAMGLDKRREVVGGSYGASVTKQATLYGAALAIVAAIVIGFILLAGKLDQSPDTVADKAPWATVPDAPQNPPDPLQ